MREFLFVDDMAQAVVFALETNYRIIIQCRDRRRFDHQRISETIQIGPREIIWDSSKPDGTPKKWIIQNACHG
jgi:GDP-L-fucose synthase